MVNPDGTTCTIIGFGECRDRYVKIPPVIYGYSVTRIGDYAFEKIGRIIDSVTIPDSVTYIGKSAFS